jgi:hypothetical protein
MKKALFATILGLAVLGTAALSLEQGGSEVQTTAQATTYDLGKVPSVGVKSLQGKDLKLRLENGAYKLLAPIRFEDLASADKVAGGARMDVSYQVGTVNDLPFVITINAPAENAASGKEFVKEVEAPVEKLLAAFDTSSIIDAQKCVGEKVCTKTCTTNGKEHCCEYRCK